MYNLPSWLTELLKIETVWQDFGYQVQDYMAGLATLDDLIDLALDFGYETIEIGD